jgi:hypothetical protein
MPGRGAGKTAKGGKLALKKETVRDLTVKDAAKKVKGGMPKTGTCR